MTPKKIIEYVNAEGKVPFLEWLLALDLEVRARIRTRINRLSLGNPGDCESVEKGVFELKFHFGSGPRVYFAYMGPTVVVLLSGGDKRTQKKDIPTAQSFWEDYKRRRR